MTAPPTPPRILVVEDEVLWSRVLHHRLKAAGYQVDCAANGAAALGWLRTAQALPDLILTDLMMPVAGGYELCAGVRAHPRLAHLPIVLMSAGDSPESQQQAAHFGIFRYLVKPLPVAQVLATVGAALAAGGI
jgi:CheY-like chemotaxis protein